MKKGYIAREVNNQTVDEEEFNDFDTSDNSNWVMLPWTEDFETQVYNCFKSDSPGNNYIFDKTICKWVRNE